VHAAAEPAHCTGPLHACLLPGHRHAI
jgi:hypothetical protein